MRRPSLMRQYLIASISGLLLAAPFIQPSWFVTPWLAFIPLFWCLRQAYHYLQCYLLGLMFGLAFAVAAGYWISPFIYLLKGYSYPTSFLIGIVFWVYSAQLFACACLASIWLIRCGKISELVAFPLIFGLFIHHFPMVFSPYLGGTQIKFELALQGVDLFGEQALSTLIILVNVTLLQAFTMGARCLSRKANGIATLLICCWFGYSAWSLSLWQSRMEQWSTLAIGLIQPNEAPQRGHTASVPGYSRTFPAEMDMSEQLVTAGAQWVIWPEARYKGYLELPRVRDAYHHAVKNLSTPLLFQDMERTSDGENTLLRNAAILLSGNDEPADIHFKVKRVPFGEYHPLAEAIPPIKPLLASFFGGFTDTIKPGIAAGFFTLSEFKIAPLICFEVMFGDYVAEQVQGRAEGAILTVLSSNGWFGSSRQPYQHLYGGALRAVENRLPMVHVMNNGPSAIILPTGRIIAETPFQQAGGYLLKLPYSAVSGGSFYTRHPHLFSSSCWVALSLLTLVAICHRRNQRYLARRARTTTQTS
ncbi:apolipoprotein N-acyltransferase [Ketobacter alkanivorans]|uniref:Apolipoprotein N-acyltransferase n=2 Tax=Ketobacter alkanivorans TaxID=1917421 RepID=A0A2K9LJU6_9GAMM|nr:apolipoprotein N-acyltransferase [Ketobacter alkanivorans]